MLSDFGLATLVSQSYGFGAPIAWDASNDGRDKAGVRWNIKLDGDFAYVIFPGTEDPRDLFRDVDAIPVETAIGHVHSGFHKGMLATNDAITSFCGSRKIVLAGHSLGAARTTIYAAYQVLCNWPPVRRVVFGEPLSTFAQGAALARRVPGVSYCAKDKILSDLIPGLPPAIGYERATDLHALPVRFSKAAFDDLGPLWLHSILGYAAALDPATA